MILLVAVLAVSIALLCALVVRDHYHLAVLEDELALEACRTRDLEVALRRTTPPPPRWEP